MCIAAAPLALISAGLSAVGAVYGGLQAKAQGEYQAQIAERNAAMEREAAQQEQENTRQAALAHYRQVAQLKGQQIVAAAANGNVLDFGTAAQTASDTEMLSREDVGRLYQQGYQNVRGHDIGAANDMAEASAKRQAGTGALVGSLFSAGSTVLGGVSQYNKLSGGGSLASSVKKTQAKYASIF